MLPTKNFFFKIKQKAVYDHYIFVLVEKNVALTGRYAV